jgi:hypothetical protein
VTPQNCGGFCQKITEDVKKATLFSVVSCREKSKEREMKFQVLYKNSKVII